VPDPIQFEIVSRSNENFEVTISIPWVQSQWPMPTGSYFESDIKSSKDSENAILSFASTGSPRQNARVITPVYDGQNNFVHLGFFAPQAAIANLVRPVEYVMDVILFRPRGSFDPRIDVIADGIVTIKKGVTND